MKTCTTCGKEITNGVNGCAWYDTCFDCKPIRYRSAPVRQTGADEGADFWEGAILARQEAYYDD